MRLHTITLTAFNRPHYLQQVLDSLQKVAGVANWHLYVGLEPGNDACKAICEAIGFMPCTILYNEQALGIRGNPFNVLQYAFDQGSTLNIHLEDDLLVSPDICRLALWYQQLVPESQLYEVEVFFLNLFVTSLGHEAVDELTVSDFFSPWGMVMNRHQWQNMIAPYWWDDDHSYPQQFDWTLSLSERMNRNKQLVVLAPLLSRTTHIGREDGVHSYPERHDLMMNGLAMHLEDRKLDYCLNPDAHIPWRRLDYDKMIVKDDVKASSFK